MALFLSESSAFAFSNKTYEEVLIEGIELSQEFGQLNEAILRADFILDQKCKNLNESAALNLQEGFLSNVGSAIKKMGERIIAWIKETAKKVKDKVVEFYNRIKDRVTGNVITPPKSKIANLEATVSFIEANGKLQEQIAKATNAEVVKSLQERATKLKEEFDKKKEANNKLEGNQTVSITYYEKLVKAAQYNETAANSVTSELEKRIKELESSLSDQKELTSIAQKNSERHRQATNKANDELDNAKSDNSKLQAEVAALKEALAAAKQLATNNASALASLMGPNDGSQQIQGPEKPEGEEMRQKANMNTREKPGMGTREKPGMGTREKPGMGTRQKPNMNTRG
jgi:DNA repair exonuclease SbcCD ATPase subunit